jgi:hypothetical protein
LFKNLLKFSFKKFLYLVNMGKSKRCSMSISIWSIYWSILSFMGSYTSNIIYDNSS